jgi:formylmethanofuran dehydrogenase subunit C
MKKDKKKKNIDNDKIFSALLAADEVMRLSIIYREAKKQHDEYFEQYVAGSSLANECFSLDVLFRSLKSKAIDLRICLTNYLELRQELIESGVINEKEA